jgi:calcineurin-like phosphoesterase family protein
MSVVRLISDLHWGHRNMALHRGFSDEEDMNEHIVSQWNKTVGKRDVVWILGDLTMEKGGYSFLDRLNGQKKVILGNHDLPQHVPKMLPYVLSVGGMVAKKFGDTKCFLTHCPVHPSELDYLVQICIHGHVHFKTLVDKRYWNVSAEVLDYTPKTFDELQKIYWNG